MFQHSGDTNYCVKENEEKSTKHRLYMLVEMLLSYSV